MPNPARDSTSPARCLNVAGYRRLTSQECVNLDTHSGKNFVDNRGQILTEFALPNPNALSPVGESTEKGVFGIASSVS